MCESLKEGVGIVRCVAVSIVVELIRNIHAAFLSVWFYVVDHIVNGLFFQIAIKYEDNMSGENWMID